MDTTYMKNLITESELKAETFKLDMAEEREVFSKKEGVDGVKTDRYKAIWNIDTDSLSCIASDKYKILQHSSVFRSFFSELDKFGVSYSGKFHNHRDKVEAIVFFDNKLIKDDAKGIRFGMRVVNSYDKTNCLTGDMFAYRLVCSNGMYLGTAIKGVKLSRRHIGDIDLTADMQKFIQDAINSEEELNNLISEAMAESIEWGVVETMLEELIKVDKWRDLIFEELYSVGRNITRWDIYNAITHIATHDENVTEYLRDMLQMKAQKVLIAPLTSSLGGN